MDDLENRFAFHPATDDVTREAHQAIRSIMLSTAMLVEDVCPPGREKSLAVTKLEEAMMWANASIARSGPVE